MKKDSSAHDGLYFVIQKGKAQCSQGNLFPQFHVTSHQKHYWNNEKGEADYLAVTEDDVLFNPPGPSFGQCKLKPASGGYLPCMFAPVGKWKNTYEKVKVMNKSCLTEISELKCTTGGVITVKEHGQTAEITRQHIINTDPKAQYHINPLLNYKEFQEEQEDDLNICY
ncbi:MAG: DUF4280 domain-containing protein [Chryseobacterium sp.]|uniref:DUF4280 domain-containing protein n=1 Tax=Chryseobacterium sp. TaxID=1871047 RepID=UPI002830A25D|nr:DUF4280 domain-containing protein [Chryseobacterium sp.]MDR2238602.1 DUF4280 domain-containing protein [Chryseobacterium sp.]